VIRRLAPDEWQIYRRVRLHALESDPAAFSSRFEHEAEFGEAQWRERLGRSGVFVAVVGGEEVGLVGGIKAPDGDGAELVSMWVAPGWRGTEVAGRLIGSVREWAEREGHARLSLWVVEGNERAEKAYAKQGFARTGREQPVRVGEPALEFEMELRPGGPRRGL
jgi:GNAT superfamily N-acetyltransferase